MTHTKFSENATLERDLASEWQLPRRELAHHRGSLVEDLDWGRRGRAIVYTSDGVSKMRVLLGLDSAEEVPGRRVGIVTERRILNPRMIEVIHDHARVLVTVRDQGLYIPGMLAFIRRNGPGWAEAMKPRRKGVPNVNREELEHIKRELGN